MYGVARRPQRRSSFAGFGAVEGGWETMSIWKSRRTYVWADLTKAIAAAVPTPATQYFEQARVPVADVANLIQAEVDAGQWTRFREAIISKKFAEARRLYGLGRALAATLEKPVGPMTTWREPTVNPAPPPTVSPDLVKIAASPFPVSTTPTGVSVIPAPGGGVESVLVGVPGGAFISHGLHTTLRQVVAGMPLWQWAAVAGVGLAGLGLAAKLARLALFGGVIAGGAWAATQLPEYLEARARRARLEQ